MFSCPRCRARFDAAAVPTALVCPRCRDKSGVFSPLTFWLFDPPPGDDRRKDPTGTEKPRAA
jgi:hypothetical protein